MIRFHGRRSPLYFMHNVQLCPVHIINQYRRFREAFFVTYCKPHHAATKDTLARWIKDVLSQIGVDTTVFNPHSCRHSASSSTAKSSGVPLHKILKSGQWATESTFYKFYQRQILWSDVTENKEFADSILANR